MSFKVDVIQDYQADCIVINVKGQFNWYKKVEPLTFFQDTTLTSFENYIKQYSFNEYLKVSIQFLVSFTNKAKLLKLMEFKFREVLEDKINDSEAVSTAISSLLKMLDERWEQTPFSNIQEEFFDMSSAPEFDTAALSKRLPGVDKIVKFPCKCTVPKHRFEDTLFQVIIHLNDDIKWSREAIADWIESLDINTEFKLSKKGLQNA
jgi:hypothetical protein